MRFLGRPSDTALWLGVVAIVAALSWAPAQAQFAEEVSGLRPASPQPGDGALQPGLLPTYYFHIFNFVIEIPEYARDAPGVEGEPIPRLDYLVGSGPVLTSARRDGVGADINGFIRFDEPGLYRFAARSNDGVRVEIGERLVISDPTVHADRFSPIVPVLVDEAGWYPIRVLYFEKRNTSTLQLFWLPPDSKRGLTFVPGGHFAHVR